MNSDLPGFQKVDELTAAVTAHARAARTERLHPVRVGHAIACGKALLELKELLIYGRWGIWVEERCGLHRMTANRYMRLAGRTEKLTRYMTIREAYLAAQVITEKGASPGAGP